MKDQQAYAPHCDSRVLHAPKECEFCDLYPEWQEYREIACINFTGHYDDNKILCPSEHFRSLNSIEKWPGNRKEGWGG